MDRNRTRRSERDEEPVSRRRSERDSEPRRGGSSRRSSFEYQQRSADDAKKRSQGGGDFDRILSDSVKMFKPNDGDNRIRILPPTWEGAKHFGLDIYVHYSVGADSATYLCANKMKGEDCPICDEREKAVRDGDEDYAKELAPKKRVLAYVIDRDAEKEGVQAWAMPPSFDLSVLKVSLDKSTGEVLTIDHPEDGFDVEFEKKGQGMRTEYQGVAIARRTSTLGNDKWLDFAVDNPLPDQLNHFDFDHVARAFGGAGARKEKSRDDEGSDRGGRQRESGREAEPARRGGKREEPAVTWDSIHDMTGNELEDLIDQENLDIDPGDAKDDEDLADWICEEMKITKPEPTVRRRASTEDDDDRLKRMRNSRRD